MSSVWKSVQKKDSLSWQRTHHRARSHLFIYSVMYQFSKRALGTALLATEFMMLRAVLICYLQALLARISARCSKTELRMRIAIPLEMVKVDIHIVVGSWKPYCQLALPWCSLRMSLVYASNHLSRVWDVSRQWRLACVGGVLLLGVAFVCT